MPDFLPFRGLRYDTDGVRLDQVIAPPYDVIGSAERVRLANRHTANAVLVELPEPDLQAGVDRYRVAAGLLQRWRHDGVLLEERAPALYPYRMTTPDGRSSTGVIGALGLAVPGEGDVLPHEETLPKPRSDRLDLLRATRANLSPIWGLSMTAGLSGLLDTGSTAAGDAYDDDGVRHQLWVMTDPSAVAAVAGAVASSPVVIADGHHRYETALAYQRERREAEGERPGPYDQVMALVVELSDDQLMVGPIHRTLAALLEGTDLPEALSPWFDVVRAGPADERTVGALGDAGSLALVTADDAYLLIPRDGAYEEAGSDLDSSLVALALRSLPPHDATHQHTVGEAWAAVASGEAQAALLLRPVTVEQISTWAGARRRMPPKTTYFWPKPRTGMVFRSLDD